MKIEDMFNKITTSTDCKIQLDANKMSTTFNIGGYADYIDSIVNSGIITTTSGTSGNLYNTKPLDIKLDFNHTPEIKTIKLGDCMNTPKVKLIKTVGKKTFVYWTDDTFTKVKCEKDQQPDPFAAFCIAFTKKMLGSTTAILTEIEEHDEQIQREKQKEANRKKHEEQRKKEREAFDKEVEQKRHELAVLRAAEKKLEKEKGAN